MKKIVKMNPVTMCHPTHSSMAVGWVYDDGSHDIFNLTDDEVIAWISDLSGYLRTKCQTTR